jgi:hypothetical protein
MSAPQEVSTYAQRLERYTKQRAEWLQGLKQVLTPAVEQTLRKLGQAAGLCAEAKPESYTLVWAFEQLLRNLLTKWTDEEIVAEMGTKASSDAETYLQMAVKAHATVLALSTAQKCRQIISVPTITKFYKMVLTVCSTDFPHPEMFCTDDIDARAKVRTWIDHIVGSQAINIVPVSLFVGGRGGVSFEAQAIPEMPVVAPAPVPAPKVVPAPVPAPPQEELSVSIPAPAPVPVAQKEEPEEEEVEEEEEEAEAVA